MLGLGAVGLACALTCQYFAAVCAQGFGRSLRKEDVYKRQHLCNEENAATLVRLLENGCERFALCNIGQENNTPELALESVRFAYPDAGEDAVEGVSFSIQPGQTLGIIGGTGCGLSLIHI